MLSNYPTAPATLSDEQVAQFRRDGYLAFENLLSPEEVIEATDALRDIVHGLASDPANYRVHEKDHVNRAGSGGWYQRKDERGFAQLEPDFNPEGKSLEEIDLGVRKLMYFRDMHPFFVQLLKGPSKLTGIFESLIGQDPILFQDMSLVKPPFIGSEKPWHQDNAYFAVSPLEAVVGVWIALDEAKVENGCMHVIPGGQNLGALRHHHTTDCEIMPGRLEVEKAVPVELAPGGALFFYGLLPHETPPNRSPERRRALQFHYRSASSEIVDKETYDQVFAEHDGTPASCAAAK